jgi:adenine phosphoribosyltransferase
MNKVKQSITQYLTQSIRNIPDFPQKGIQYKDITTLLKDPDALQLTSNLLKRPFIDEKIDFVVGLESRGFLFGPRLAQDLNAGFIPIRKPGKLPAETISATFELEYGEDTLEMHTDAISKGDRILIHDDLKATGGSAKAGTELVQELGGIVVGYSFITALKDLEGQQKLPDGVITDVLMWL